MREAHAFRLNLSATTLFAAACMAAAEHPRRLLLTDQGTQHNNVSWPVVIAVAAAIVSFLGIFGAVYLYRRRMASSRNGVAEKRVKGSKTYTKPKENEIRAVKLNDLQISTNGFSKQNTIEDAGHSAVFKGDGPDGECWAVKRAKRVSLEGTHLFRNEVDFLSQMNHPNVLPLLGYCNENNEQILVFEYMGGGALCDWLRPSEADRPALTFRQRVHIALGVAEGVSYLHSFTKPAIIHRDLKSETILLDDSFEVKVGGLGLLKHLPGEAMRIRMARKRGYLDPEYFQTFKVTSKCDVYSFGVIILELITGKNPIYQEAVPASVDGPAKPFVTLAQWAQPRLTNGRLKEIADPRMKGEYPKEAMEAFAKVAAACILPLRKSRPDMAKVAFLLEELETAMANPSAALPDPSAALHNGSGKGHRVVPM